MKMLEGKKKEKNEEKEKNSFWCILLIFFNKREIFGNFMVISYLPLFSCTVSIKRMNYTVWGRRVIGISGSLIWSKTLMKLIFNPCCEFR